MRVKKEAGVFLLLSHFSNKYFGKSIRLPSKTFPHTLNELPDSGVRTMFVSLSAGFAETSITV